MAPKVDIQRSLEEIFGRTQKASSRIQGAIGLVADAFDY